ELSVARAEAPPRGEEGASRVELLNAIVARIRDVDVPAPVGRHAVGVAELPVPRAEAPPRGEEGTVRVELLDAVVGGAIGDVDVPARVGRHVAGAPEFSVARAPRNTPRQQQRAATALPAAPSTTVIAARFAGAVRRAAHPELRGRRLRAQAAAAALVGAAGSTVGLAAPRERVAVSAQRQYDGGEEERSCDMLHHAPPPGPRASNAGVFASS